VAPVKPTRTVSPHQLQHLLSSFQDFTLHLDLSPICLSTSVEISLQEPGASVLPSPNSPTPGLDHGDMVCPCSTNPNPHLRKERTREGSILWGPLTNVLARDFGSNAPSTIRKIEDAIHQI